MPFIEWDDSLSLDLAEIDAQHKREVELLNRLHDAKDSDKKAIFHKIAEHTVMHFSTEEKYFDRFHYSKSAAHKEAHQNFLKEVARIGAEVDAGKGLSAKNENLIKVWLVNHIKSMDAKYVNCFKDNGMV
ncbi:bacteriohemerythrin [Candidatus Woesearchaeota archaeon]|nr:bacteriohemerythrin [Candidatus Woesearchaeota archaeon]